MEYRGLNLLDDISTVELAFDLSAEVIHVFDTNQVVEPEFNFTTKSYQLSDGFYKMAKVLYEKQFIAPSEEETFESWVKRKTWFFYGSKKSILKYDGTNISKVINLESVNEVQIIKNHLYKKYLSRLIGMR